MEKKIAVKSLIIGLLFFLMYIFCVASAEADETELLDIKELALEKIDEAFMEIAENKEEFHEVLALTEDYIPENTIYLLNNVIEVSQLDMGPEEKLCALLEASGAEYCLIFLGIYLVGLMFGFIPIIGWIIAIPLATIGFWGGLICVLLLT